MQRVACLVPVGVVLAADDVQEVALGEAEVVVAIGGLVVVEGFNNLCKYGGSNCVSESGNFGDMTARVQGRL